MKKKPLTPPRPPTSAVWIWNNKKSLWRLKITSGEPRNRPHLFQVMIKVGADFVFHSLAKSSATFERGHAGAQVRLWEIGDGKRFLGNSIGIGTRVPSSPS